MNLRRVHQAAAALGCLLGGVSDLLAAPTITVTMPAPGEPILNPRAQIVISYSTSGAPLDLASLTVRVNGLDLSDRFQVGPESASYTLSTAQALVAGSATIEAGIQDTATPPVTASASETYEVLPKLLSVSPSTTVEAAVLTIGAQGLDPDPARNRVVFRSLFAAEVEAPFLSVDRVTEQGTVRLPDGAATGPMGLRTNGRTSPESLPVTVTSSLPHCGSIGYLGKMTAEPRGGFFVLYSSYRSGLDPRCAFVRPWERSPVVVYMDPSGRQHLLATSGPDNNPYILALAVDKAGQDVAIVMTVLIGSEPHGAVRYRGVVSTYERSEFLGGSDADMDVAGNLWMVGRGPTERTRLVRISAAHLRAGGEVVPEIVADNLDVRHPPHCNGLERVVVSCDGHAHVGIPFYPDSPGLCPVEYRERWDEGIVRKVDLATGTVEQDILIDNGVLRSLALNCHTNELFGQAWTTGPWFVPPPPPPSRPIRQEIWRSVNGGTPTRLVEMDGDQSWVTVAPNGTLIVDAVGRSHSTPDRVFVRLPQHRVEPCSGCVGESCPSQPVYQPFCLSSLLYPVRIKPETTRWRPQRSTEGVVEVRFEAPRGLKPGTTLQITGPSGQLSGQNLAFAVVDGQSDPATYKITWSGPWQTGAPAAYLARGDYRVQVRGVMPDDSIVTSSPNDPNSTVSLVEVIGVELLPDTDDPRPQPLTNNPALPAHDGQRPPQDRPGAGKRIFAEAQAPNGPVLNKVLVRATIAPTVPDLRGQAPIAVRFKSFDVDDPARRDPQDNAPNLADADLDHFIGFRVDDNRGTPKEGTLSPPVVAPGPGQATVQTTFITSLQPGDNYRILATTSPQWRDTVRAYQPNQDGELCRAENEPCLGTPLAAEERHTISEMLTVWRTLHLETDSMPAPPGRDTAAERNFIAGTMLAARDPQAIGSVTRPTRLDLLPDVTEPPVSLPDDSPDLSTGAGNGRFEHGTIALGLGPGTVEVGKLDGNGLLHARKNAGIELPFRLEASGRPTLQGFVLEWEGARRFVVDTAIPSGTYGGGTFEVAGVRWTVTQAGGAEVLVLEDQVIPFRLQDDDAARPPFTGCGAGGSGVAFCSDLLAAASDNPARNVLAQAYIQIAYDLVGTSRTPPFKRNLPDLSAWQEQLNAGRDPTTRSTNSYWAMYLQAAFQPFTYVRLDEDTDLGDGDPNAESALAQFLAVSGSFSDEFGSLVFVETIRDFVTNGFCDFPRLVSEIMAHELGHQFGLTHANGGIMTIDSPCDISPYHSSLSLNDIRWKSISNVAERRAR